MVDQQTLYTLAEASALTGLSVEALRLRIKRGKLEGVRGNDGHPRVRLTSADLEAIQQAGQRNSTLAQPEPTLDNVGTIELNVLATAVETLRERAERAEARAEAAQALADRRGEELAELRERAGRAEGEAAALREQAKAAEARLRGSEEARIAAEAELADWSAGGPLARAWRAFLYRRGRA
jgi:hypothetical protein